MQQERPSHISQNGALLAGFVVIALLVVALTATSGMSFDTWAALVIAPTLFIVSLPALSRQAAREGDRRVFWFLVLALTAKLAGALVRHFITFDIYGGTDAVGYHQAGAALAVKFRAGDFHTGLASLSGTNFMIFLTGLLYTVIGPTKLGGFFFFSWLGFWGLYFFYRAFVLAVPEGRRRTYGRLLFFMPSLLFWPSSIGKESWMMFTLGIAAFGVAQILTGRIWRGLVTAAFWMWLATMIRPHVPGLMAVALAAAYLVRRSPKKMTELAPVVKVLSLGMLAALAFVLVAKTDSFLRDSGIQTQQGVTSVISQVSLRTTEGHSKFVPSVLGSPARAPVAFMTVLFRPFVTEANNAQAIAAAMEGTFLFLLTLIRLRWIWAAIRSGRRQSYVAWAAVYSFLFVLAFSGIANFGLLARQRVQLLPLYLVLLAVPPAEQRGVLDAGTKDPGLAVDPPNPAPAFAR